MIGSRLGRATLATSLGQAVSGVSSLSRAILIAPLIGPDNLGIAAVFLAIAQAMDTASALSIDRLMIQADDGNNPRLQSMAQAIEVTRGFLIASLLFVAGPALATALNLELAAPYARVLAFVPLARGLAHFDMKRRQRELRFGSAVWVESVSNIASLLAIWPLSWIYDDYRISLWAVIVQAVFYVIGSHVVASRRYSIRWDRQQAGRILRFGTPLIINGLFLLVVFQGDRLVMASLGPITGREIFSLTDIGIYAAAFALTSQLAQMVSNIGYRIFLPLFSEQRRGALHMREVLLRSGILWGATCSATAAVCAVLGPIAISFLYGEQYLAAVSLVIWMGAMQGIRMLRVLPTQLCMSFGDTATIARASAIRSLGLPLAIPLALMTNAAVALVWAAIASELPAWIYVVYKLRRYGIRRSLVLLPAIPSVAVTGIVCCMALVWSSQ